MVFTAAVASHKGQANDPVTKPSQATPPNYLCFYETLTGGFKAALRLKADSAAVSVGIPKYFRNCEEMSTPIGHLDET